MSSNKTPASPQDEFPILRTEEEEEEEASGSDRNKLDPDLLSTLCTEEEEEEVVLMATINPARTTGNTNPELHLVS